MSAKTTSPRPIPGILLHPHIDQKFWHEIDLMQFTAQIEPDMGLLYQKMASLSLLDKDKRVLTFELHRVGLRMPMLWFMFQKKENV